MFDRRSSSPSAAGSTSGPSLCRQANTDSLASHGATRLVVLRGEPTSAPEAAGATDEFPVGLLTFGAVAEMAQRRAALAGLRGQARLKTRFVDDRYSCYDEVNIGISTILVFGDILVFYEQITL